MKSASYEYRNMSARRGAKFVPIGLPTVFWKTFLAKNKDNIVNVKLKHLDDIIFSVFVFRVRVLLYKICFFVPLYQIFVSAVTSFENKAFLIILVSLFFNFW